MAQQESNHKHNHKHNNNRSNQKQTHHRLADVTSDELKLEQAVQIFAGLQAFLLQREYREFSKELEIPYIVVFGAQSSGKSSFYEYGIADYMRHFFPRGIGATTRRPLVLRLHPQLDPQLGNALHVQLCGRDATPVVVQTLEDWERIAGEMGELVKEAVETPIEVNVWGRHFLGCTYVDLPGIVAAAMGSITPSDIERFRGYVEQYAGKNRNCFRVVAVAPGDGGSARDQIVRDLGVGAFQQLDLPADVRSFVLLTKADVYATRGEDNQPSLPETIREFKACFPNQYVLACCSLPSLSEVYQLERHFHHHQREFTREGVLAPRQVIRQIQKKFLQQLEPHMLPTLIAKLVDFRRCELEALRALVPHDFQHMIDVENSAGSRGAVTVAIRNKFISDLIANLTKAIANVHSTLPKPPLCSEDAAEQYVEDWTHRLDPLLATAARQLTPQPAGLDVSAFDNETAANLKESTLAVLSNRFKEVRKCRNLFLSPEEPQLAFGELSRIVAIEMLLPYLENRKKLLTETDFTFDSFNAVWDRIARINECLIAIQEAGRQIAELVQDQTEPPQK